MNRPPLEVADIVRAHGEAFLQRYEGVLSADHKQVLKLLVACRTAKLGGHIYECDLCGHQRPEYNSCRNRHCPKCQASASVAWVAAREQDLLPVPYFHVVFTLPHELSEMVLQNPRLLYNLLFSAAWKTLRKIAADKKHLGAQVGMLAVLHTWGQNVLHHPHLHCLVPGGGLSADGQQWVPCRQRKFFLPVRVLSEVFRGKFLDGLQRTYHRGLLTLASDLESLQDPKAFGQLLDRLHRKKWTVYAKRPFGSPERVLKYLARYTHRVAISNRRLLKLENGQVSFRWKDYRHGQHWRTMTLTAVEFLRRFLLHVLPKSLMRIRQFGFLANCCRCRQLALCRKLLGVTTVEAKLEEEVAELNGKCDASGPTAEPVTPPSCPACGQGCLRPVWSKERPKAQAVYETNWSELLDTS